MYIFLDESGQLNKNSKERYFVIGSFSVKDPRKTSKAFRNWINSKFPKKIRNQVEVKWSQAGIDKYLRLKTIKFLSSLEIEIVFGYVLKKNIPFKYFKNNKLQSGYLYTYLASLVLEQYFPVNSGSLSIYCDARSLSKMSKKDFNYYISTHLQNLTHKNMKIDVQMIDSTSNINIQIADWLCGAMFKTLEQNALGHEYYNLLKNCIKKEIKFFE